MINENMDPEIKQDFTKLESISPKNEKENMRNKNSRDQLIPLNIKEKIHCRICDYTCFLHIKMNKHLVRFHEKNKPQ